MLDFGSTTKQKTMDRQAPTSDGPAHPPQHYKKTKEAKNEKEIPQFISIIINRLELKMDTTEHDRQKWIPDTHAILNDSHATLYLKMGGMLTMMGTVCIARQHRHCHSLSPSILFDAFDAV